MNLSPLQALQQHFGFDAFQPGQQAVVEHLLEGRSAAAVFPTGGGKSLCYQLPALLLPGVTLVVSPLIALMKDQIDALARRGIRAQRLDSSLDAEAYRDTMAALRSGELRLLYVAPERFNNERFRAAIAGLRIVLFAVDEAHCISEWGHNFRPDYLKLAGIAERLGAERILALTATATPPVLDDICRLFRIAPDCAVRIGFYRSNLQLLSRPVAAAEREAALIDCLRRQPAGPGIIYVTRQKTAEQLANMLSAAGWPARAYHAGMETEARSAVQEWFLAADKALVVATIAFGMGVDKPDIRGVIHYNPPKSLENYAQEIGRAGRDGGPAVCTLLFCPDDLNALENFIYGDTQERGSLAGLVQYLFASDEHFELALGRVSDRFDIRPLVLRTLLTYLELDGYLEEGTPFYADYRFKPQLSSAEILARFEGERREFLRALFARARRARIWFTIDLAASAEALGCDRDRIVKALDWLGENGLLEVQAAGMQHRYRRLRQPDDTAALVDSLNLRLQQREAAELARLQQVVRMVSQPDCRSMALAHHFGETMDEACGSCSACLGEVDALPPRSTATIPAGLAERLTPLLESAGEVLASPRRLTRFLCGCSSPALTRARLSRDASFGMLDEVPFAEVLAWAERFTGSQ